MSKMKVVAVKITEDVASFKLAYEKNGKIFVRSGEDQFTIGTRVHGSYSSLWKWGFRKVDNPPILRDSEELNQNYMKFQMKSDGSISYTG